MFDNIMNRTLWLLGGAVLFAVVNHAMAEDGTSSPWTITGPNGLTISRPQSLTITCGKGSVSISMDDGSVKFTDCEPDKGAQAFWEAIRAMYGVGCPRQ
jgi:hypothetical protein